MEQNRALNTVRKLLRKAERASTVAEAQAYNAKATELIASYGIDAALLATSGATTDHVGTRRMVIDGPYSSDKADLLTGIASPLRCTVIRHRRSDRRGATTITMLGFASDLERVELLYTSLLLQTSSQMVCIHPPDPSESVAAYRRSWLNAYSLAVERRLRTAEKNAEQQSTAAGGNSGGACTALVLRDRTAQVEQAVTEAFPRLKTMRSRTLSGTGARTGYAAGQRADLGGRSVGQPSRHQLGGR